MWKEIHSEWRFIQWLKIIIILKNIAIKKSNLLSIKLGFFVKHIFLCNLVQAYRGMRCV